MPYNKLKKNLTKKPRTIKCSSCRKDAIDGQLETALTKVSDLESQLASLKEALMKLLIKRLLN